MALLVGMVLAQQALAAETLHFRLNGASLYGQTDDTVDECASGCTSVSVMENRFSNVTGSFEGEGKPYRETGIYFSQYYYNPWREVFVISAGLPVTTVLKVTGHARTARVNATILSHVCGYVRICGDRPCYDIWTCEDRPVDFDLTFVATEEATRNRMIDYSHSAGEYVIHWREKGDYRGGIMTGSIDGIPIELPAYLSAGALGSLMVIHE
jgi:hypothetical protein